MSVLLSGVTSIDRQIIEWFNSINPPWGNLLLIFVSLFMAALLSGVIGFEREYHGHSAGLRTHILVAVGSALVMIISIYGFDNAVSPNRDPARLAAQVVSGIGFLGAGTIIQTGTDIKGLTTATTLWLVMGIGLAAGSGNFIIAIIATVVSFTTLVSLRKVEKIASRRVPKIILVVPADTPVLKTIHLIALHLGVSIRDIQSQMVVLQNTPCLRVTLSIAYMSKATTTAFVDELRTTVKPIELRVSTDA